MDSHQTGNSRLNVPESFDLVSSNADEPEFYACNDFSTFDNFDRWSAHQPEQISPARHSYNDETIYPLNVESNSTHARGIDIRPQYNYPQNNPPPIYFDQQSPPWVPPTLSISEPGPSAIRVPGVTGEIRNLPNAPTDASLPNPSFDGYHPVSHNNTYSNTNGTDCWSQGDFVAETGTSFALSADLATSPQSYRQDPDALVTWPTSPNEGLQGDQLAFEPDDAISTNPDPQAGLAMEWMEGLDTMPLPKSQVFAEDQSDGAGDPLAGIVSSRPRSNNERAFVGGLFSTSAGETHRSTGPFGRTTSGRPSARFGIPRQGDRYEPGVSGSFPTTQHKYSQALQPLSDFTRPRESMWEKEFLQGQEHQAKASLSLPMPPTHLRERVRKPGRRQSTASSAAPDRRKLGAIAEGREASAIRDGASPSSAAAAQLMQRIPSSKAKRRGHLSDEARAGAAQIRRDKSICIACKLRKIQCDGGIPCKSCVGGRQERCCVISHWMHDFNDDPCASSFHLFVFSAHQSCFLDPIALLSPQIDPKALLEFIASVGQYNLHVRHATGSSYTINLSETFNLLARRTELCELQDIFKPEDLGKSDKSAREWLKVVMVSEPAPSDLRRLWKWGTLPAKATYHLVSTSHCLPDLPITDSDRLHAAATISRVVLRASELVGFQELQQQCSKFPPTRKDNIGLDDIKAVAKHTGKLACLLRLKVAFCQQTQSSPVLDSLYCDSNPETLSKVEGATKTLYFWHTALEKNAKRKDHSFKRKNNKLKIHQRLVADPFPEIETQSGFEQWLADGQQVLRDAGFEVIPHTSSTTEYTKHSSSEFDYDASLTWGNQMFSSF